LQARRHVVPVQEYPLDSRDDSGKVMKRNEYILDRAEATLRSGGLVIVPTETFYALAGDPFNENTLRRIFGVKARPETKPLPLIAADRRTLDGVVEPPEGPTLSLIERFWPGSLTILLKPVIPVSPLLTGPDGKIAVRVPPWCAARMLAARLGGWITATSANLSGGPEPDDVWKIDPRVLEAVDLVLKLGPTPGGRPSTVVEPLAHGFRIVRPGAIDEAAIREVFRQGAVA